MWCSKGLSAIASPAVMAHVELNPKRARTEPIKSAAYQNAKFTMDSALHTAEDALEKADAKVDATLCKLLEERNKHRAIVDEIRHNVRRYRLKTREMLRADKVLSAVQVCNLVQEGTRLLTSSTRDLITSRFHCENMVKLYETMFSETITPFNDVKTTCVHAIKTAFSLDQSLCTPDQQIPFFQTIGTIQNMQVAPTEVQRCQDLCHLVDELDVKIEKYINTVPTFIDAAAEGGVELTTKANYKDYEDEF